MLLWTHNIYTHTDAGREGRIKEKQERNRREREGGRERGKEIQKDCSVPTGHPDVS
jgi:hypothetical protein